MKELINHCLRNDLKEIQKSNPEISKGDTGNYSIEVKETNPIALSSYVYPNQKDRDKDFESLTKMLLTRK